MSLLDLVGNAATGGVLGILGTIGGGVISIFQARNQFKHDEAMADLNLRMIAAQSDAASKLSADQLKTMTEQQAGQAFVSSQMGAAPAANTPAVILGILSLWRPLLTALLIGLTVWYYPDASADMKSFIIQAMVTCCVTAVTWWFGSRQIEKYLASKPLPQP